MAAAQWHNLQKNPPKHDTGILLHQETAPFSRWELMQYDTQSRCVYVMPKTVHESRVYHPIDNFPEDTLYIDLRDIQPQTAALCNANTKLQKM